MGKKDITFNQAIGMVVGAIITTAISTSVALLRVANSDHFRVLALEQSVGELKGVTVPRSELKIYFDKIDRMDIKIDRLLELSK